MPHFATSASQPRGSSNMHGVQVIDADKEFKYTTRDHTTQYALTCLESLTSLPTSRSRRSRPQASTTTLISVFGSQSTGKSTLPQPPLRHRLWRHVRGGATADNKGYLAVEEQNVASNGAAKDMADNILVMGRRGARTAGNEARTRILSARALCFALATSEVLIVNIWEHQVGLSVPRSLLFFVIRDHIGNTPLANLRATLLQDLSRIWASLSKPPGLETSKIDDYFDFEFVALPHKILQPEKFVSDVRKLGTRFREGYKDPKQAGLRLQENSSGILLPEYHRRIPADGFSVYAAGVWDQIVNNKDLDLPTQQELLAQFRCDEISREVLVAFDAAIGTLETTQTEGTRAGKLALLAGLGTTMKQSRIAGQLSAAHKIGVQVFTESVSDAVRQGQKRGASYDFAQIVAEQKAKSIARFEKEGQALNIEGVAWSDHRQALTCVPEGARGSVQLHPHRGRTRALPRRIYGTASGTLSPKSRSKRSSASPTAHRGFDASTEEVDLGLWRLRRKSWAALRAKIDEEVMEGNLLLKLREK
ncbi:hypothetical protein MRB53_041399 [Persea americana]|nr:hypothetical protein MRB53_041399 [Persea americana]